ncbi:MAG: radical SAM protein [Anaerolineales bacterium]
MGAIFGPVPSRRLGQSLGIDPIPSKTCNWNCVYCQLGRTVPLTNQRKEYIPREQILSELKEALEAHQPEEIDWITFVGSGEPTLHSGIGWLIREIKKITNLPLAVITNGSLLYLEEVRQELLPADAVLPTLDAGNAQLYRKINRPWPEITFDRLVDGLIQFRQEYRGKLWVEVMLVQGLNDTPQALAEIAALLKDIKPDQVHINLPTRPPAEEWVKPPTQEGILQAISILGEIAHPVSPADGSFDLSGHASIEDAILDILARHPIEEKVLRQNVERYTRGNSEDVLQNLIRSGKVQVVERFGDRFWSIAQAVYSAKKD